MNNSTGFQLSTFFKRLLLIQGIGFIAVLALGFLLYARQGSELGILLHAPLIGLVTSLVVFRKKLITEARNCLTFLRHSLMLNASLFAVLVMSVLVNTQNSQLATQQFFFMAMFSAMTGMLMARVWKGLSPEQSES